MEKDVKKMWKKNDGKLKDFLVIKMEYNGNILYVRTGVAHKEQITDCFLRAIREVKEISGIKEKCEFQVNLLMVNDSYCGVCYIWISDKRIFNILLGLDENGNERWGEIKDPNWKELTPEEHTHYQNTDSFIEIDFYENWRKGPYKIGKLLPIVNIPGYRYTDEQRKYLETKMKNVPELGHFEIGNAVINDVKQFECDNVLLTTKVTEDSIHHFLKTMFTKYTTDPQKTAIIEFNGTTIRDTYPVICRTPDNDVFIVFDPETSDAKKAILMTRKLKLTNKKTNMPFHLYFSHAPLPGHKFFKKNSHYPPQIKN